jgi:hypothetical protein
MKSFTRVLLIGLLTTTMLTYGASIILAAPPPHPHPGPHHGPHHGPNMWPFYQPVIVRGVTTYYGLDATNPLPLADIRLVNPQENRVTLRFRLNNGALQSLPAGYSIEINRTAIITFDRGGAAGQARYSLTDGTYKFVASGGMWDLVRQSIQDAGIALTTNEDVNPLPGN